jgi:hypothetical protein
MKECYEEQVAYTLKGQYYEMILWPFKFLYYDTKEGRVRGSFCFVQSKTKQFLAWKHSRMIPLLLTVYLKKLWSYLLSSFFAASSCFLRALTSLRLSCSPG